MEICYFCNSETPVENTKICRSCRVKYNLSKKEDEFINHFIYISYSEYSDEERLICMSGSAETVIGKCRNFLNDFILHLYKGSHKPLDLLAIATTYSRMHAAHRPMAIKFWELYLKNPVSLPKIYQYAYSEIKSERGRDVYSIWQLYSRFANIYEAEQQYDKAIVALNQLPKYNNMTNPADYTRVADIMVKRDGVDKAIEYIESLKKQNIYINIKHAVDFKYNELLEKKKKGYVYRPRKNNKEIYYAK